MKQSKYYLSALTAFFIWGFFSFALKPLHHYPSLDILFYRVFLSVILMSFVNVVFRRNTLKQNWNQFKNSDFKHKKSIALLALGGGVLISFNWFLFIYVMNHVNVQAASLAYLICPILTTVFAFFILKEKLGNWQWIGVSISFLACILLSLGHFDDIFYSIIIAATYGLYLVSQRRNSEIDKFLLLNIQLLFTAVLIIPFYPKFSGAIPTDIVFYNYLLLIVVLFTIIPLFLNLYALKGISSSAVGIMIYINPLINFLLAIFYYKEEVTKLQLGAYSLILVSIIVFNKKIIFSKKEKAIKVR